MGDIYTNPPQSRNEAILRATIDGTEYTAPPQSRIEDLLIELKAAIEQSGGGTTVVANPEGAATDEVKKLQVGSTVYAIEDEAGRQLLDDTVGWVAHKWDNISDAKQYGAGATWSVSGNSIAINGTEPYSGVYYEIELPNDTYKFSCIATITGGTYKQITIYDSDNSTALANTGEFNASAKKELTFTVTHGKIYLRVYASRGSAGSMTLSDVLIINHASVDESKVDTSVIAPVENGAKASQRYTQGQHFQRNGDLYTVSTTIAENEDIVEGTNCVKEPYAIKNTLAGNIAELMALVPAITDSAIAYIGSLVVGALTNNEITGVGGVIIISKVSATVHRWYGMCGNTYLAMGYITNGAYTSHRVIYQDTETAEATNPHEDITLNTTNKYAVKNGKTVNFKVRFTLANDIASGSNVRLFDLPYLPNLQYLNFIIYDTTADQFTTQFAFVGNTNGRVYVSKGLTAGGYEISGTYICQ